MKHTELLSEIINGLREIGSEQCRSKASLLEAHELPLNKLHFRNLDLKYADVLVLNSILSAVSDLGSSIVSISFSNNPKLGNNGVMEILKNMPKSLTELGFVNCGISDSGGFEILKWMEKVSNLQLVCLEGNNFLKYLKTYFSTYESANHSVVSIY